MAGFIKVRISLYVRRVVTMIPALAVLALGVSPTSALVLSQVVLSFGIPFALIPLVLLTSRRDVMGVHVNEPLTTRLAWAMAALITGAERVPALRAAVRLRAGQEACARSSRRSASACASSRSRPRCRSTASASFSRS